MSVGSSNAEHHKQRDNSETTADRVNNHKSCPKSNWKLSHRELNLYQTLTS